MNSALTLIEASSMSDYLRIARADHWFKNVFVLPGVAVAALLTNVEFPEYLKPLLIGLFSTCLVASANYIVNEWFDREFDRHHPLKKRRPSAAGRVTGVYVALEYVAFSGIGLGLANQVSTEFLSVSVLLLLMGIVYNVNKHRRGFRAANLANTFKETTNKASTVLIVVNREFYGEYYKNGEVEQSMNKEYRKVDRVSYYYFDIYTFQRNS